MRLEELVLVLARLTHGVYGKWRFQKILSGLLVIVGLVFSAALMMSIALVGGLYAAYLALLAHGVDHYDALLLIIAIAIGLSVIVVQVIRTRINLLMRSRYVRTRTGDVVDSFMDGLLGE